MFTHLLMTLAVVPIIHMNVLKRAVVIDLRSLAYLVGGSRRPDCLFIRSFIRSSVCLSVCLSFCLADRQSVQFGYVRMCDHVVKWIGPQGNANESILIG